MSDGSCNATYSSDNPFDDANINTEIAQHWPLNDTHIAATAGDINSCTKTDATQTERLTDGNCSLGALEATPSETTSSETASSETSNTVNETSSEEINANDGNAVLTDSNDRTITNVNTSINGGAGSLGFLFFMLFGLASFSRQDSVKIRR